MRILVVSDTHGAYDRLRFVVRRHLKDAQTLLHVGDGAQELLELAKAYPQLPMQITRGNCDWAYPSLPSELLLHPRRHTIFACHGDRYGVKGGTEMLERQARSKGADIAVYGHTHEKLTAYRDGLYLLNPGSLGSPRGCPPSYGFIDLTDAGIVTNIVEVKRFDY